MDYGKKTAGRRPKRVGALLQEVITEVIRKEMGNPHVHRWTTVMHVKPSADLRYARVFVSVAGSELEKNITLAALQASSGFIASRAAKMVSMRYFPHLDFRLDTSVDKDQALAAVFLAIEEKRRVKEEALTVDEK